MILPITWMEVSVILTEWWHLSVIASWILISIWPSPLKYKSLVWRNNWRILLAILGKSIYSSVWIRSLSLHNRNKTLNGGRAERNEYILLHEFHRLKYICPDKQWGKKYASKSEPNDDPDAQEDMSKSKKKDKYKGGKVLEPKKGLWDKYILVMDFNSLYPSIIQEYNIDFTTVERLEEEEDEVGSCFFRANYVYRWSLAWRTCIRRTSRPWNPSRRSSSTYCYSCRASPTGQVTHERPKGYACSAAASTALVCIPLDKKTDTFQIVWYQAASIEAHSQQYVWVSRIRAFKILRSPVGCFDYLQGSRNFNQYYRAGRESQLFCAFPYIYLFCLINLDVLGCLWWHWLGIRQLQR